MSSFVLTALLAAPGADPLFLADSDGPIFVADPVPVVAPVAIPKPLPAPPVVTYAPLPAPSCRWVWTGRQWVQMCPTR